MNTHPAYFEDTYRFEDQAVITAMGQDENGHFILLNQTIFHPQGGGQPSDQGTLQMKDIIIPIHRVKTVDNMIKHYTDKDYGPLIGQTVSCTLDQEKRLTHARLHTAGHLISHIIESLAPHWNSVKGHHFPNECYVEFTSQNGNLEPFSEKLLTQEIEKYIELDCSITTNQVVGDKVIVRSVRIGDFPFSPCGGTHVKSLKELKGLKITRIKIKNNTMKISYGI